MSTWDVVNTITIVGVILAPITTFVFIACGLFNISSAMRKHSLDNQLLYQQLAQKDTLLAYLLSQGIRNGRGQEEYVKYDNNADFYTAPTSVPTTLGNKQAEVRQSRHSFIIGVLTGICAFLLTALLIIIC